MHQPVKFEYLGLRTKTQYATAPDVAGSGNGLRQGPRPNLRTESRLCGGSGIAARALPAPLGRRRIQTTASVRRRWRYRNLRTMLAAGLLRGTEVPASAGSRL